MLTPFAATTSRPRTNKTHEFFSLTCTSLTSLTALSGNLLADFVAATPPRLWSAEVVDGIFMHRRIDVMTDNLPEVTEAKAWFRPETRRVAPISLDVMWDHFLSRHWAQLSPEMPLPDFCALCPPAGVDHSARLSAALCESE